MIVPCNCNCCQKNKLMFDHEIDNMYESYLSDLVKKAQKKGKEMQTTLRKPLEGFEPIEGYRKLVMPQDLNAANRLFGGTLMSWFDEAAALYAMCVAKTKNVVTLKVSEVIFKEPMMQGDFLTFRTSLVAKGTSSLTIQVEAFAKDITRSEPNKLVCHCEMIFVTINPETGRGIPHNI